MSLDPEELRRLRSQLQTGDAAARESAVRRLAAMVQASAPDVLVEALASDSVEVRRHALELLEQMAESDDPTLARIVAAVRGVGQGA